MIKRLVCILCLLFFLSGIPVSVSAKSAFLVKEGMEGENVRQVQQLLIDRGFLKGTADGICGSATVAAIAEFQKSAGLTADGICGDETLARLKQEASSSARSESASGLLKRGMTGDKVKTLQELLFKHGYLLTAPDGIYGSGTETAVKTFQQDTGLAADGICGNETMSRLLNLHITKNPDGTSVSSKEDSAYAAPGSVIKPGMHGDGVILLQEYLIDLGYLTDNADGIFGPKSVTALKLFQRDNNLMPDGICGKSTYAALQMNPQTTEPVPPPASTGMTPANGRAVHVEASAYSPMDPGLSLYTATGKFLRHGIIAVDPAFIPLGTHVFIPGYGEATADDIGGAIKGNHIDIAFDTHEEALAFGTRSMDIYVLDE